MADKIKNFTTLITSIAFLLHFIANAILLTIAMMSAFVYYQLTVSKSPVIQTEFLSLMNHFDSVDSYRITIYLYCVLLFLLWIYITKRRLVKMGLQGYHFSPAFSVICFFIPLVNLVWGYQAIKEVWQATVPNFTTDDWKVRKSSLVLLWWLLFLAANIGMNSLYKFKPVTESDLIVFFICICLTLILYLVGAILGIYIINKINLNFKSQLIIDSRH